MRKMKYLILMLVLGMILMVGCTAEEGSQDSQPANEESAAINKMSDEERLTMAIEQLESAESFHQATDFNIEMSFNEEMKEASENEFIAQMIAMMSSISMQMDMSFENYDYQNPAGNLDLKCSGIMNAKMGDMEYKMLIYVNDQKVYVDDGLNGLYYTAIENQTDTMEQNMFDTSFFLLDDVDFENVVVEEVQLESSGEVLEVTKFAFDNNMQMIMDILEEDDNLSELVDTEGDNPLEGIEFENMIYNMYINEENELVHVEIAFGMTLPEEAEMMGIEVVDYRIDMWIDGIGETVIEFPDLSGAIEQVEQ
jgi:hypothetical protein